MLMKLVNVNVLNYERNSASLADVACAPRYVFAQSDIADGAFVGKLLAEHQIDFVVNFAAESRVHRSVNFPELYIRKNVTGAPRLLCLSNLKWAEDLAKIFSRQRLGALR